MFSVRQLKESDYTELVKWWNDWEFKPLTKANLPSNGTSGVMVSIEDVNICAGFLWVTNSDIAWIGFAVSDRNITDKGIRNDALEILINNLTNTAFSQGFTTVFTVSTNKSLINKHKNCGFVVGSNNATELIKTI